MPIDFTWRGMDPSDVLQGRIQVRLTYRERSLADVVSAPAVQIAFIQPED